MQQQRPLAQRCRHTYIYIAKSRIEHAHWPHFACWCSLLSNTCWWQVMMTVVVGMNNVKIKILTTNLLSKTRENSQSSAARLHYSKSALYNSGGVPLFLFSVPWVLWMCQLSNRHRVMVCRWWSMTSDLVRSTGWAVSKVCSARADAATSPFLGPVDALPVDAWGFNQSVQCIPWSIHLQGKVLRSCTICTRSIRCPVL